MFKDNYDLELSCASANACSAYLAGIDNALRLDHPGIRELTEAVDRDPDFALAHAALARQLQIHGLTEKVAGHLDRAVSLKPAATRREQSAIDVIVAAAHFREDALKLASRHTEEFPRDIFILSHIVGPFGLLAFSGQRAWREENVALLDALKNSYPADDWWYLSTLSFTAAEVGDLVAARKYGEHAWRLSENGNCAHSLAHVHFEEAAVDEGMDFIDKWLGTRGVDSDMRHHLVWHLALLLREQGAPASELLAIYERELDPRVSDPMPLSTFSDNAALLWRCSLSGLEIPADIRQDLADYADRHYPDNGFAFADIHRIMSTALHDSDAERRALADGISRAKDYSGTRLGVALVRYAEGFYAFASRDFATAIERLEPVVADSVLLGGSNPQRRIVEETYRAALNARIEANA